MVLNIILVHHNYTGSLEINLVLLKPRLWILDGRYVLMVSLYNRLGGHVMRWSNLKGQQWGGTTLPINHDGHFYNAEIKV